MKLVVFSDLHLDSAFAWAGAGPAAQQRRQALRDVLEAIVTLTERERADALLCGGDLYEDSRLTPDTVAFVAALFERLAPVPVLLAPGNHDWLGPASLYRRARWSENVHVFTSSRLEPYRLATGLTVWGGAHHGPSGTPGFLDGFRVAGDGVHLGLFHGSVETWLADEGRGKDRHAPFTAEQIEQAGLDFAFLGHFHRPRREPRYLYPGNPEPLSFGEDGLRGAVVATVAPTGAVATAWHEVAITPVHDLTVDLTGCASQHEARSRLQAALAGKRGVARVTLTGELHPDASIRLPDLAGLDCGLDAYRLHVSQVTAAYPLAEIAREQTVRGQFVRDVLAANDLPDDERRRVLLTGLRALDGRVDLEVL